MQHHLENKLMLEHCGFRIDSKEAGWYTATYIGLPDSGLRTNERPSIVLEPTLMAMPFMAVIPTVMHRLHISSCQTHIQNVYNQSQYNKNKYEHNNEIGTKPEINK